jgi:hypothetical protein
MFRFTIRDVMWLTLVVALGAAILFARWARENEGPAAKRRASAQEIEAASARYEAAKGEFDWLKAQVYGRPPGPTDVCNAMERFAHATEMKNDPESRVKDLASALDHAQQLASITQDKYEQGVEHVTTLYRVQYTRADMEARLRRAEQELAAAGAKR